MGARGFNSARSQLDVASNSGGWRWCRRGLVRLFQLCAFLRGVCGLFLKISSQAIILVPLGDFGLLSQESGLQTPGLVAVRIQADRIFNLWQPIRYASLRFIILIVRRLIILNSDLISILNQLLAVFTIGDGNRAIKITFGKDGEGIRAAVRCDSRIVDTLLNPSLSFIKQFLLLLLPLMLIFSFILFPSRFRLLVSRFCEITE